MRNFVKEVVGKIPLLSFNIQYSTSWMCHPSLSPLLVWFFRPWLLPKNIHVNMKWSNQKFTSIDWFLWLFGVGRTISCSLNEAHSSIIQTGWNVYHSYLIDFLDVSLSLFSCSGKKTAELCLRDVTRQKTSPMPFIINFIDLIRFKLFERCCELCACVSFSLHIMKRDWTSRLLYNRCGWLDFPIKRNNPEFCCLRRC